MSTNLFDQQKCKTMFKKMYTHYDEQGRHALPWRRSITPYKVVVSEIMLQQTQVSRVESYFREWMTKYPSWKALSEAPLRDVLLSWQGLGYNRRGKYLHDIAQIVRTEYAGRLPSDREKLESLPGIGHYTAGSIRAFAFDEPDLFLETNIRTVLFHYFYNNSRKMLKSIDDKELLELLDQCIQNSARAKSSPRELYWAFMDYGSHLKKHVGNLNNKSKTYNRQSRFEGSRRQLRSQLLRYILHNGPLSQKRILEQSNREVTLVKELLKELVKEESVSKKGSLYDV